MCSSWVWCPLFPDKCIKNANFCQIIKKSIPKQNSNKIHTVLLHMIDCSVQTQSRHCFTFFRRYSTADKPDWKILSYKIQNIYLIMKLFVTSYRSFKLNSWEWSCKDCLQEINWRESISNKQAHWLNHTCPLSSSH